MCPGPDRGANLLFCVTQCFLVAPGSGTPKFFKLGRADDSLPEWRSADPSLNSISEFRLNLYGYWSKETKAIEKRARRYDRKFIRSGKISAPWPLFSHHRRQQPFPQHHEVIGFGLSKHQPHALIWMRIDDACLRLKKLGLGEKFYRQGRPHRIRNFGIHITTI